MSDTNTYIPSKDEDFDSSNSFSTDRASNDFFPALPSLGTLSSPETIALPETIPASIFNHGLSGLEAIVFYLKETQGLRFCQIALLLNRDDRTIWDAHNEACQKAQGTLFSHPSSIMIPLCVFQDRGLGILEALSEYLKESLQLRYCQIASLLGKNDRTIWTAYSRAKKKRKIHHAS